MGDCYLDLSQFFFFDPSSYIIFLITSVVLFWFSSVTSKYHYCLSVQPLYFIQEVY